MTIRARWNDSRMAIVDRRVRQGAWMTLTACICALVVTTLAIVGSSTPIMWFLAGMTDGMVLISLVSLASTVTMARKTRDSQAMAHAASVMIAGMVADELKTKGLDVEVTAGPEGIAVRRLRPTTVH